MCINIIRKLCSESLLCKIKRELSISVSSSVTKWASSWPTTSLQRLTSPSHIASVHLEHRPGWYTRTQKNLIKAIKISLCFQKQEGSGWLEPVARCGEKGSETTGTAAMSIQNLDQDHHTFSWWLQTLFAVCLCFYFHSNCKNWCYWFL